MKPTSFSRAMAGAGGQLREQGRDCVEGVHIPSLAQAVAEPRYRAVLPVFACWVADHSSSPAWCRSTGVMVRSSARRLAHGSKKTSDVVYFPFSTHTNAARRSFSASASE